jgi:hypothetical protein
VRDSWIILLAPVLFWAHIMEEAPRFMRWYNSVVSPPLPESGFVAGNVAPLLITIVLAAAAAWFGWKEPRRKEAAFLLLIWLSYFMFANTIFHVTATLALRRYCPGLITAVALYLPYFAWYARYLRTSLSVHALSIGIVSALAVGVVYMQWHKVLFKN